MAYLIFFELRFEERDKRGLRGILPGSFCFFLSLGAGLKKGEEMSSLLPSVLWHTLVLTVCAGVFLLVETGMTCVIVTHEMRFAEEVSDRILFIADGNILEDGTPEQVFHNPQHPRLQDFLKKVL